jgi:leader peptidase (prepilin peptidase) / N-methyltransferase
MLVMDETAAAALFLALLGAAIGSFVNVVAYRLPRGESIVRPRSRCPGCGVQIAAYDNVPVLSWVVLSGRCRRCHGRISPQYPIVEALTGALFAAVALRTDLSAELWPGLVLMALLVTVSAIDIEHRIVPNRLLLPAAATALVLWALVDPGRLPENLIAAAAAGGFLLAAAVAYPAGMGMGDVKLAAVMGLFLGRAVVPAIFAALVAGTVLGAIIIARYGAKEGRKKGIPFGPWLALGSLVGLFAGDQIVDWYLDSFT